MRRLIDEGNTEHDSTRYIDEETLTADNDDSGEHRAIVVPSALTGTNLWREEIESASGPSPGK